MLWSEMQAPRRAQTSPLATAYSQLLRATTAGDVVTVDALFQTLFGLHLPAADAANTLGAPPVREMLRYRGFKPAELAMLAADIKPVVKFEDIPLAQAQAFVDRFEETYVLARSATYLKDGLLLRSHPCAPTHPQALQTIYASRSDASRALQRLEDADPEDIRGAGALLGIPDCCAEAFALDFEQSRTDQDTLNDDACIRLLRTATAERSDARMCPLSDLELLGFYPCRVDCDHAHARANLVLQALERHAAGRASTTIQALGGSYLFWRLPFFARLPAPATADGWTPTAGFEVNLFAHRSVRAVQLRFAAHLGRALSELEAVRIEDRGDAGSALLGRRPSGEIIAIGGGTASASTSPTIAGLPETAPRIAQFPAPAALAASSWLDANLSQTNLDRR